MRKPYEVLPPALSVADILIECATCEKVTFFTNTNNTDFQLSQSEVGLEGFPTITLKVDKTKGHAYKGTSPYLFVRPNYFTACGYFLKFNGRIKSLNRMNDEKFDEVVFRVTSIELKSMDTASVRETFEIK